ncbi:MAG: FkbM family methyltransferase [Litoreibacter sp.]|nr:FkbM family methyltransferase [Litoreibacter sp.]
MKTKDNNTIFQPVMLPHRPAGFYEFVMLHGRSLPGKLGYFCFRKLKRRQFRRNERAFYQVVSDLRRGDICVDLGANVGEFTRLMADKGAEVIAYEPDPETFARLNEAVGARANVQLHQKAAGAQNGIVQLQRAARYDEHPEKFSQASSLVRRDASMDPKNSVDVEVIDFVAELKAMDRDIRILKVDIEGSEFELLDALIQDPIVNRIDTIFVETHEWMDPVNYVPMVIRFQEWAERVERPYLNLFWL